LPPLLAGSAGQREVCLSIVTDGRDARRQMAIVGVVG
jgi:hypothetical protein